MDHPDASEASQQMQSASRVDWSQGVGADQYAEAIMSSPTIFAGHLPGRADAAKAFASQNAQQIYIFNSNSSFQLDMFSKCCNSKESLESLSDTRMHILRSQTKYLAEAEGLR